jgi:hypothetical protein
MALTLSPIKRITSAVGPMNLKPGSADNGGDVEVAVGGCRRADAYGFVGEPHVHQLAVGLGVGGYRSHAHFPARAQNAERDLAAIGDNDFVEHARVA